MRILTRTCRLSGYVSFAILLPVVLVGCDQSHEVTGPGDGPIELEYTFDRGAEGWSGAFADYSAGKTPFDLDLVFDRRPLPSELQSEGMALYLQGRNESDDLFMYLRHRVTGLQRSTSYAVTFELELASNASSGCVGIGGAPGESVFVKAGAAAEEPVPVVQNGDYRLSVDKGNQSTGGARAVVIGTIANGANECTGDAPYRRLTLSNGREPLTASTDADGNLWLFVGTDSGFEGTTALYYDTIRVRLEAL